MSENVKTRRAALGAISKRTVQKNVRSRPKPPDHPVSRLSFVANRDGKVLPKSKAGRCFWHVTPSGDYRRDNIIGEKLALEYLAFEEEDIGGAGLLPSIVGDMPAKLTAIEISFLAMVSYAARAGAGRAREISAYWGRCRAEESA